MLDTEHEFYCLFIEQEGFFHSCISFTPTGRVGKKIDLFNIVKMVKKVGEVVKDSSASRISQRVFFDCWLVSPMFVTRVKELARLNMYSCVEICLQFFRGGNENLFVRRICFEFWEQFVEGFTGRIYCFTVDNVTHEIQRTVGRKLFASHIAFRVICKLYSAIKNLNIVFSFCCRGSDEAAIFCNIVRYENVAFQKEIGWIFEIVFECFEGDFFDVHGNAPI